MSDKDHRKVDDGTAGPRPHGVSNGELIEDLHIRPKFLRDKHVHVKVVKPVVVKDEPKASKVAQTK